MDEGDFAVLRDELTEAIAAGNLDANVVSLVELLVDGYGIMTTESCGGHDAPGGPLGRERAGRWRVTFELPEDDDDCRAVAMLAHAVSSAEGVRLTIEGRHGAAQVYLRGEGDPEAFAAHARDVLTEFTIDTEDDG
jgi:hypothetical protein